MRFPHVLIATVLIASACTDDDDGSAFDQLGSDNQAESGDVAPANFPGQDWAVADPTEAGFDVQLLEQVVAESDSLTNCMLVTRHGQIVGEWYWNGWTQETTAPVFSVTQAYTGTLIGIAQAEGVLNIDDRLSDYIPELVGTESEDVTIRHVLSHTSGRESTYGIANQELSNQFVAAEDPGEFSIELSQDLPPGTEWNQNLPAIELLGRVLVAATGQDPAAYAQEKLFGPIGAQHTAYGQTMAGVTWMHTLLTTSCRDAARLGYLFLQQGNWDGNQVVPEEWVAEATSPSQELNKGFGYFWWLNRPGSLLSAEHFRDPDFEEPADQKLITEAPEDMFWAIGLGPNLIQVHPSTDTVVVRLGTPTSPDEVAATKLLPRVVTEALTNP